MIISRFRLKPISKTIFLLLTSVFFLWAPDRWEICSTNFFVTRNKLEADIAAIVKSLDVGRLVEEGKQITAHLLFKMGRRRSTTTSQHEEEEDKKAWEDLPSMERRLYMEAAKNVLQQMGKRVQ